MFRYRQLGVTFAPVIRLTDWRVFETEDKQRYFAGWNGAEEEALVTSPIVSFDAEVQKGVTLIACVYELVGPEGQSEIANCAWEWWARSCNFRGYTDVSSEYGRQKPSSSPQES